MPVTVIKKPEWGLFYYHLQGYCTGEELVQVVEEVVQHPLERAFTIFDLLEGELDMNHQEMMQLISINKRLHNAGKTTTHAAILTQNRILEIFVKAFDLISINEQTKLNTFSSLTEALAWMRLSEHEQELLAILNSGQSRRALS